MNSFSWRYHRIKWGAEGGRRGQVTYGMICPDAILADYVHVLTAASCVVIVEFVLLLIALDEVETVGILPLLPPRQ